MLMIMLMIILMIMLMMMTCIGLIVIDAVDVYDVTFARDGSQFANLEEMQFATHDEHAKY